MQNLFIFSVVCIILENFGADLHNLKLSKKGRIIVIYVLHKTAGTAHSNVNFA